jgi:5-methylcytosine-specific restriction endonuclease McrBC GTP-binding regulatory subunit McrB
MRALGKKNDEAASQHRQIRASTEVSAPSITRQRMPQFLDRSASGDQLHQKHNNGYHEKNVDQITDRRTGEPKPKSPQHQQDQNNCPKHRITSKG